MTLQETSVLGAQPFLRGLPDHHLAKLAAVCQHVAVPSGRRPFDEDARADRFWLIDAGRVVRRLEATHARLIDACTRFGTTF